MSISMWVMATGATVVVLVVGKVLLDLANKEIQGWLRELPFIVLRLARRRLPAELREELHDGHLLEDELRTILFHTHEDKPITALVKGFQFALGCVVGAGRNARAAGAPPKSMLSMRQLRSRCWQLATFTVIGLGLTISAGLVWYTVASGENVFEPAVGLLGLLGGLAGIYAERRTAVHERRRVAFATLFVELHRVAAILDDSQLTLSGNTVRRSQAYPRLPVSAIEAVRLSGALNERDDVHLLNQLHNWHHDVNDFNRRLDLTEIRLFGDSHVTAQELADLDRAMHHEDGPLAKVRHRLQELQDCLTKAW